MSAIDEVRALHAPVAWSRGDYRCEGCDGDGYESETPAWPCRTGVIVYTRDEIALVAWLQAEGRHHFRVETQQRRAERDARVAAGKATQADKSAMIQEAVVERMLRPQLEAIPMFTRWASAK